MTRSEIVKNFIDFRKLIVLRAVPDEIHEIVQISDKHPKLSISDCSVFYFGKKNNLTVLTNDKVLREIAKEVKVHGILWIFDRLIINRILSKDKAVQMLQKLMEINQRLPVDECRKKIKEWSF